MASFVVNMEAISVLQSILVNTFNADPQLRAEAEASLKLYFTLPAALTSLICFVGNHDVHRDLRQAAAIAIKNNSRDFYRLDERALPIPLDEKEKAKPMLLDILLTETDNSVRGLLAEAIKNICEFEYPERWPALLPTLLSHIQTPDILKMYNALTALRRLVKRYEYKQKDDRKPLHDIIEVTFPLLQELMLSVVQNNSLEAAQVMRLVLKIFWSCTNYALPVVRNVDVNFWFSIFAQLLEKRLPEASEGIEPIGQPVSPEERAEWPWWKVKKWAIRILQHFMHRYGNPQYASEENKDFSTHFRSHTAAALLPSVLNTLAAHHREGQFITETVHRQCLLYVCGAVEMSPTYKLIKPHLDFLLFGVIFPILCITPDEIRLFEDEPIEFVRKVHNPLEDWLDPRVAATNVLQTLARYRQKDTLPRLLPFCNGILQEFSKAHPSSRDYRKKDGVIVAVACVAKIMFESTKYANQVEPFLTQHIVPEFQSPVGYMRCRACWALEFFGDLVPWQSMPSTLQTILQGLLQGLKDPCLPTQSAAACALRTLVSVQGAKELLTPVVHEIISEYFRIMAELDSDSLLSSLQELVKEYGETVVDIAPAIVAQLLAAFRQYSTAGEDDDEGTFAASQCLDTIMTVLEVSSENAVVLVQLEAQLSPVLSSFFSEKDDAIEYLDSAVAILGYLTYYLEHLNPTLWQIFPLLLVAMDSWAFDYMQEISTPVLNYISKEPDVFLQGQFEGKSFLDMLSALIHKALHENRDDEEREAKAAAKMLGAVVACCRGRIDTYIPVALQFVAMRLADAQTLALTVRLLEVAMAAIYYDAHIALEIFRGDPATTELLFKTLFEKLPGMTRGSSQRLIVLSFSSLYQLPSTSLPAVVRTNLQPMLAQMIREVVMLETEGGEEEDDDEDGEDEEGDEDGENEEGDGDEDEEEEEEEEDDGHKTEKLSSNRLSRLSVPEDGFDEEEDCVNVEDEEYRQMLEGVEKEGKDKAVKRTLYSGGFAVSGDMGDDEDDDEDDEDEYTSPLDTLDVAQALRSAVMIMQNREPQLINSLRAGLDEDDRTRFDGLMALHSTP